MRFHTLCLAATHFAIWLTAVCFSAELIAGDWPQILGPNRDGVAKGESLSQSWPSGGPKLLWKKEAGQGFAGVAVANGQVVMFHRFGNKDRVESFNATTGKVNWKKEFSTNYRARVSPDSGPRCVPILTENFVITFSSAGKLECMSAKDGASVWSRDLYEDYKADEGYFGAGSSPLLLNGKLFLNVGGRGAGLVALDAKTGKTIWNKTNLKASYAAPVAIKQQGKERLLFVTRVKTVIVDPASGDVLSSYDFGQRGPTVNAAMPLVNGSNVFLSASYNIGSHLLKMDGDQLERVWKNKELSSQYSTAIWHDGYIYGSDGREDFGPRDFKCVDAKTGKVKWTKRGFGLVHLIQVGNQALSCSIDGKLSLLNLDPKGFSQVTQAKVFEGGAKSLPALAGGKLYWRSDGPNGELKCLAVGK